MLGLGAMLCHGMRACTRFAVPCSAGGLGREKDAVRPRAWEVLADVELKPHARVASCRLVADVRAMPCHATQVCMRGGGAGLRQWCQAAGMLEVGAMLCHGMWACTRVAVPGSVGRPLQAQ